jgi:hypothetical protein
MMNVLTNLWQAQRPLIMAGVGFMLAASVLALLMQLDSSQITGVNRWLKPLKFSLSAGIFLLTVAVYLFFLPGFEALKSIILYGLILIMAGEVSLITMQAARGTTSHFNTSTQFDAAVFSAMALMILLNTLLIAALMLFYFQDGIPLPPTVIWGMRLGLIVFLLGSLEGGFMASHGSHTIGAADGGAGLPFINWSVSAGDLRVAHFLGLHALQVIPLAALLVQFLHERFSLPLPRLAIFVFAAFYGAAFTLVFVQALQQKPFITQR